jgi:hypothetical protein
MSTLDLLKAIAPELDPGDGSADARLTMHLEMAANRLSAPQWGQVYPEACARLAAHLVTLSDRAMLAEGAPGGTVASVGTARWSMSFGALPAKNAEEASLASTVHGQMFLELRRSRAARAPRLFRGAGG